MDHIDLIKTYFMIMGIIFCFDIILLAMFYDLCDDFSVIFLIIITVFWIIAVPLILLIAIGLKLRKELNIKLDN